MCDQDDHMQLDCHFETNGIIYNRLIQIIADENMIGENVLKLASKTFPINLQWKQIAEQYNFGHCLISLCTFAIYCPSRYQFYSYYIRTGQQIMQQYSYYIVPIIPCAQGLSTISQPQPVVLPLATVPNITAPIIHYAFPLSYQNYQPAPPEPQQPLPNQEILPNPQSSQRYIHQASPSTPPATQTIVIDHNVFKYPKKNAESNLINQIFSYISIPSKSSEIVSRILGKNEERSRFFYEVMRNLKRQNKKYINRTYLKDLLLMEKSHIIHGILQKIKIENYLPKEELKTLLRKLTFIFLREKCILSIITSSKLDRFAIKEHLQRRREVSEYLCYHLRASKQSE